MTTLQKREAELNTAKAAYDKVNTIKKKKELAEVVIRCLAGLKTLNSDPLFQKIIQEAITQEQRDLKAAFSHAAWRAAADKLFKAQAAYDALLNA